MNAAWLDITAHDPDTAGAFYGRLFGWQVDVDEQMNYGIVSAGGPPLGGIGRASNGLQAPGVVVYLPVDDVAAAAREASELGGSVAVEPWTIPGLGTMAVITDPEGNRIGVMSPPTEADVG